MEYIKDLRRDKILKKAMNEPLPPINRTRKPFDVIVSSIISQQLSTRVADIILQRYIDLHGGKHPNPEDVLKTPHDSLRMIGLSQNKALYVKNVATFALEEGITLKKLNHLNDEEVIGYLTRIKGVGRWTVEMFMIFHLGRPDVLSKDDLVIQQAMTQMYGLEGLNKKALLNQMEEIAAPWQPWRSYACRYLWRWRDSSKKAIKSDKVLKK